MAEVWIYEGRNSPARAYWKYQDARDQQDRDNGAPADELEIFGGFAPEMGGSEEEGWFYIDDGGSITKVVVE